MRDPRAYGAPMLRHDMKMQILDSLHLAELGLPKTPTKRTAERGASRTVELRASGKARAPLKSKEGPARLVETGGYSTTFAISTFRKVEARNVLRRGSSSVASIPESLLCNTPAHRQWIRRTLQHHRWQHSSHLAAKAAQAGPFHAKQTAAL